MSFQKLFAKELISEASSLDLLSKNLSLVVSENWFVVREFFFVISDNPVNSQTTRFHCCLEKRTVALISRKM